MFSPDQIARARQTDLVPLLERLGWQLKSEAGQFRAVGRQGLIIEGNHWFHHSEGKGGNALDFLIEYCKMTFHEAMKVLVGEGQDAVIRPQRCQSQTPKIRLEFQLPQPDGDNQAIVRYLTIERGVHLDTVHKLISSSLLYQDTRKNTVFVCLDRKGVARGAVLRGTSKEGKGKPFRGMAKGSDSRYGWVWCPDSTRTYKAVTVTESPIDAISLEVLRKGFGCRHLLSLNGLRRETLSMYLREYPDTEHVFLCLDNDEAGRKAAVEMEKEAKGNVPMTVLFPLDGYKDWNEQLIGQDKQV